MVIKKDPGRYSLLFAQCTSIAAVVLQEAGVQILKPSKMGPVPLGFESIPPAALKYLIEHYSHNIIANEKFFHHK
jgi:hypothetical protein